MPFTYQDIINRVQLLSGRWDEASASPGRLAGIIDLGVQQVYQLLDSFGHPYLIGTATLTATATYTDLPADCRRVLRIEDSEGRRIFRRFETGGTKQEYEVIEGKIRWWPAYTSTATLRLYYIKKLTEPTSLTATITAPDSAYDFLVKYTLAYFTHDPLHLQASGLAWEQFVNVAYDESEVPRVFKRETRL
jgi:hypothetical protein